MNIAPDLAELDQSSWRRLETACGVAEDPFRYLTLSNIDHTNAPQSRLLVLRQIAKGQRQLEFHTDIASAKWADLQQNGAVSVLGYCQKDRLQLRLSGAATLHGPDSPVAQTAWAHLSTWTRTTYSGGPPGTDLATPSPESAPQISEAGQRRFGVIRVQVSSMDWVQLARSANRRVLFDYAPNGGLVSAHAVNP